MKKTDVNKYVDNDIRNVYNESVSNNILKKEFGLTRKIIENISKEKDEPDWVLDIRLKALEQFYKMDNPDWGPDISYLNIDDIATYVKPVDGEVRGEYHCFYAKEIEWGKKDGIERIKRRF